MTKILEINVDDQGFGGVYSLVRNIILNKPEDLQIDIACIEEFEKKEHIEELNKLGTRVFYVGYKGNKLTKQRKISENLQKLLKDEQYDAVHIHSDVAYKLYVYGTACKKAGMKKIILHSHSSGTEGSHKEIKRMLHLLCRRQLKKIGNVYLSCSSEATKWMFPNIDANDVIIIRNGIDLKKFRFNPEIRSCLRKELGIGENVLVVGHVGRFSYPKNHDYLIDVFSLLHQKNPQTKLLLIGTGEYEQQIKEKTKMLNLEDCVIFAGIQKDVYRFYQAMDVFALPSRFEGFPIVAVEAQAAGLPLFLSDRISQEVMLTDRVSYLPVTKGNIAEWAERINNCQNLNKTDGYELLKKEKFDISDTVAQLNNIYLK